MPQNATPEHFEAEARRLTPELRTAKSDTERAALQNAVSATDRQIDALVEAGGS